LSPNGPDSPYFKNQLKNLIKMHIEFPEEEPEKIKEITNTH